MNPVPLRGPNNTIWTYCCGICGRLPGGVIWSDESFIQPDGSRLEDQVNCDFETADRCCRCARCNEVPVLFGRRLEVCDACKPFREQEVREHTEKRALENARYAEIYNEHLSKALDQPSAVLLQITMSDISEDRYCASWQCRIEHELWAEVCDIENTSKTIENLRTLSQKAGGWWYWNTELGGKLFYTSEEWCTLYKDHVNDH